VAKNTHTRKYHYKVLISYIGSYMIRKYR
jgi:hypothetical protein